MLRLWNEFRSINKSSVYVQGSESLSAALLKQKTTALLLVTSAVEFAFPAVTHVHSAACTALSLVWQHVVVTFGRKGKCEHTLHSVCLKNILHHSSHRVSPYAREGGPLGNLSFLKSPPGDLILTAILCLLRPRCFKAALIKTLYCSV